MRILHVCESIIGGTGSYLAELIPHQVEKYGAEKIILLIPDSQLSFVEPEIWQAAPRILTFSRKRRISGAFHLIWAYVKAIREIRPDIIHAHSSIAGAVVRLLRVSRRARIAFCPHGWSVDMKGAVRIRALACATERIMARLPDQIIVISGHEYERALELGIRRDRLHLIANGIASEIPNVEPAAWPDSRLRILYAGRFDYQKGVDLLIKAAEGLGDRLSVRLVGGAAVGQSVLPDSLPPFVEKLDWLDREGVSAQMKSCDLLVVPSRWEGFGLVAIEAMRLSKPVAATAVGGLKEIFDDGRFGFLLPSENVQALHDFLATLDRETLKTMGKTGNARFLDRYTADRMVRSVDAVYADMMAAGKK